MLTIPRNQDVVYVKVQAKPIVYPTPVGEVTVSAAYLFEQTQ
jgi:hypothetical protein